MCIWRSYQATNTLRSSSCTARCATECDPQGPSLNPLSRSKYALSSTFRYCMRQPFVFCFVLLLHGLATAQVGHGGEPFAWGTEAAFPHNLPAVHGQPVANKKLDSGSGKADFNYGEQRPLVVDVLLEGAWDTLPDERTRCRLLLRSQGALMLSVQFDVFDPGPQGRVYLYNEERSHFLGGFTQANMLPYGGLATAVLPGEAVVIEYVRPLCDTTTAGLHVASITHGTKHLPHLAGVGIAKDFDPGFPSAPCHVGTACAAANAWQDQVSAVAMFLRPDGNGCTGTMVNNTAQDGKPYFYFANHCYQPNTEEWVFYFNYESPTCSGNEGPTVNTLSGATFRSAFFFDDFALAELNAPPPPSYNVFYAGWDRSGAAPQTGTVIHHPLYDVKKITFDNQPATSYTTVEGIQCWRTFWDNGIVEAVSSGSALFDQNKRIVGHMTEGAQDCTNAATVFTGCAKFSESWDGASPATRLRDWLDPGNTGANTLNGFYPVEPAPIRLRVKLFLQGAYDQLSGLMRDDLRTQGLLPQLDPYPGLGYVHLGNVGGNEVPSATLAVAGNNAVVDWVVLELRDKNNSSLVRYSRSALLLRNGDVVDMDGTSSLSVPLPIDDYYIAVRHRNHLAAMTQDPLAVSTTNTLRDLSDNSLALFGGAANAVATVGGVRCLWMGDADGNGILQYASSTADRGAILDVLDSPAFTTVAVGYDRADVNLDGLVKYAGLANDRDPVLVNIGGQDVQVERAQQLP
jgi:hypothetical protein